jgi:hypothetical protein
MQSLYFHWHSNKQPQQRNLLAQQDGRLRITSAHSNTSDLHSGGTSWTFRPESGLP